ncbi:MAG: hypothetical protein R2690_03240 [Acidimicrobiales bacterium]
MMAVHMIHLRDMGQIQGQNFDLEGLATDCADRGRYEFCFTAVPEPFTGGCSAPVAPVVTLVNADEVVERFALEPHPEGGVRRVFTSTEEVDGRPVGDGHPLPAPGRRAVALAPHRRHGDLVVRGRCADGIADLGRRRVGRAPSGRRGAPVTACLPMPGSLPSAWAPGAWCGAVRPGFSFDGFEDGAAVLVAAGRVRSDRGSAGEHRRPPWPPPGRRPLRMAATVVVVVSGTGSQADGLVGWRLPAG